MEQRRISVAKLKSNSGQIEGVPANPREWTKEDVSKLAKSIEQTPELLEARGIIVYPHNGDYIVMGGNMRLAAIKQLGLKDAPCIVLPEDMSTDKLREIVIKDNGSFGKWDFDALGNEWDDLPLSDFGIKMPSVKATEELSGIYYKSIYYEPSEKPNLTLKGCIDTEKYEAKVKLIREEEGLSDEQREVLMMFAYRFLRIDFESVANYYYFNASEAERNVIERLRLVLIDDGVQGFIDDELIKLHKTAEVYDSE